MTENNMKKPIQWAGKPVPGQEIIMRVIQRMLTLPGLPYCPTCPDGPLVTIEEVTNILVDEFATGLKGHGIDQEPEPAPKSTVPS